jgi:REP element-mobilizing transposase RayT
MVMMYALFMALKQMTLGGTASEFKDYWKETGRKVHGSELSRGKRKTARPFESRKPIHIIMRAKVATGAWSFRRPQRYRAVGACIDHHAQASGIHVYNLAINGNHIHFLVRAKDKPSLKKFLRATAGHLARLVTGACKGKPQGKFWDALVFTRIVEWGRAYGHVRDYILQNVFEATGFVEYRPRKARAGP